MKLEQKKEMAKKQSVSSHVGPPSTAATGKLRPVGTNEKKKRSVTTR